MLFKRNRGVFGLFAGAAFISALNAAPVKAAVLFDGVTGLTGVLGTSPHYAEQVTLAGGPGSYSISGVSTFGINWANISVGSEDVFLDFYTGANTSATATDALGSATLIMEEGFGLSAPPANGGYTYTLNFATPVVVPSNTIAMEVTFTNAAGTAYSTGTDGIYSRGTPSVGTDPGFIWIDSNLDGTFTGAEQSTTAAGGTSANIYFKVNATAVAVPEPLSGSVLVGLSLLGLMRRRTRIASTI